MVRYCCRVIIFIEGKTTAVNNLAKLENTSAFSMTDLFRIDSPHGAPKMGFSYGIIYNGKLYLYVQEDPCPCQFFIFKDVFALRFFSLNFISHFHCTLILLYSNWVLALHYNGTECSVSFKV